MSYILHFISNLPFVDMVTLYWTVMNNTANFEVTCGWKKRKKEKKMLTMRTCKYVTVIQSGNESAAT